MCKKTLLAALLHDAAEAYLADVARPVKKDLAGYRQAETLVMRAVAERFGLGWPLPPQIAWADNVMLATEKRDLMADGPEWSLIEKPCRWMKITPWSWRRAEKEFLKCYASLTKGNTHAQVA